MENKFKYIMIGIIFLMLVIPVMAKDLSPINDKPLPDKFVDKEIIKEDGIYINNIKTTNKKDADIWIDKKIGTTYHVDSNLKPKTNVTLEFYYEIQPDYIAHYYHTGKFDRYYFPTQWDWTADCDGEICSGGWVTIEDVLIDKGTGSNTFPIGTTGPTRAYDGQFYGVFDGESSTISLTGINITGSNFTISFWAKPSSIITEINVVADSIATGGLNQNQFSIRSAGYWTFWNGTWEVTTATATKDDWQFLTYSYANTTSNMSLYFDSGLIKSFIRRPSGDFVIDVISRDSVFFNGSIDEVLIYNRSLSATEIASLYANYTLLSTGPQRTSTPSTDGLVLDINFDDYSVADHSGQANHGTNTNVSFGEVLSNDITLTEDTDYTLVGAVFTVINDNFAYRGIDIDYSYWEIVRGSGYTSVNYLTLQMGEGGLAGWVPAVVALSIGMIFIGMFLIKSRRKL